MSTEYCEICGEEPTGLIYTCVKCGLSLCECCYGDITQEECVSCQNQRKFMEKKYGKGC